LILTLASPSQVQRGDPAWLAEVWARLLWLVELLRASDRAERFVRRSLRAIERPEVPDPAVWLPAGLIAMAGK